MKSFAFSAKSSDFFEEVDARTPISSCSENPTCLSFDERYLESYRDWEGLDVDGEYSDVELFVLQLSRRFSRTHKETLRAQGYRGVESVEEGFIGTKYSRRT